MKKGYRWPLRDQERTLAGSYTSQGMICTTERFYKLFRDAVAKGSVDIELKNKIYEVLRVLAVSMLREGCPDKLDQMNGLMRKILYRIDRHLLLPAETVVSISSQDTTLGNAIMDEELAEFREMYFLSVEACRLIREGKSSSVLICNGKRFMIDITDENIAKRLAKLSDGTIYGGIEAWNWHYYRGEATS